MGGGNSPPYAHCTVQVCNNAFSIFAFNLLSVTLFAGETAILLYLDL